MDSLRELYQDVILDHHRKPRNRREMAEASAQASPVWVVKVCKPN